jgi:hypothetical protein
MAEVFMQIGNILVERLLRIGRLRPRWELHKNNLGEYSCANYNSESVRADLGIFTAER